MDQYIPTGFPSHPRFLPELDQLEQDLLGRTRREVTYVVPSQEIARNAQLAMRAKQESGEMAIDRGLTRGQIKSAIYDLARGAQQLRAYEATTSLVLLQHVKAIRCSHDDREVSVFISSLRGMIERAGFLVANLRRLQSSLDSGENEMLSVINSGEITMRALYSTRLDWHAIIDGIADGNFKNLKSEDIKYKKKENIADQSAPSVLSGIDKLDNLVRGSRISYEVFCEFLHPNIGDFVGVTLNAKSFNSGSDRVRFISRTLGIGPSDLRNQVDLSYVIYTTLGVMADIFSCVALKLTELTETVARVRKVVEMAQHEILGKQRHLFARGDLCPCLSGKTIRQCAPKVWKGK